MSDIPEIEKAIKAKNKDEIQIFFEARHPHYPEEVILDLMMAYIEGRSAGIDYAREVLK